jgi:hypothetical protein
MGHVQSNPHFMTCYANNHVITNLSILVVVGAKHGKIDSFNQPYNKLDVLNF